MLVKFTTDQSEDDSKNIFNVLLHPIISNKITLIEIDARCLKHIFMEGSQVQETGLCRPYKKRLCGLQFLENEHIDYILHLI